jgi:hypothetical protein
MELLKSQSDDCVTSMEPKRVPVSSTELTREEKESILRALGYYQVHLYDKISSAKSEDLKAESDRISSSIKKIHKSIES